MAKEIILKDKDGGQLLPVTTTEQVKRGGAGKTLEDSMLEVENLVPIMAAYGCNYNAETGYFEYAGLTDLTADDCRNMLVETGMYTIEDMSCKYAYCKSRVNLSPVAAVNNKRIYSVSVYESTFNGDYAFYFSNFEIVQLCTETSNQSGAQFGFQLKSGISMFSRMSKLKKIIGQIILDKVTGSLTDMLRSLPLLETIKLKKLKMNIKIPDSPLLSYESVKYLVDNAANTDPITVTVHGDVYAKLSGTASEYGDHTQEEWTALMTAATEKQISFATV